MTTEGRRAALEAIASEVRVCQRCRLSRTRTKAVPGEGHPDTEVVFIGEGPGQREDQQGRPFVGAAGTLLGELLSMIGWQRDDVYITNVVKCRPPGNRDPEPDEMAACAPYLKRQLEVIDPALIVTLGRFSLQTFMPGERIGRVHGSERAVDPASGATSATAFAMYHPAAALRQASLKETMQRDMAAIPDALLRARRARERDETPGQSTPASPATTPAETPGSANASPSTPPAERPLGARITTSDDVADREVPDDQLGLF